MFQGGPQFFPGGMEVDRKSFRVDRKCAANFSGWTGKFSGVDRKFFRVDRRWTAKVSGWTGGGPQIFRAGPETFRGCAANWTANWTANCSANAPANFFGCFLGGFGGASWPACPQTFSFRFQLKSLRAGFGARLGASLGAGLGAGSGRSRKISGQPERFAGGPECSGASADRRSVTKFASVAQKRPRVFLAMVGLFP